MARNARPGNAVADDVLRTLILNEYFHLFSILDVIFCVKLQQLPTHFLQFPLQTLGLYIYLFKLRDQGKETLIINPLATKQISNLKIKIYYQNGLYFSNPIYKVLKFPQLHLSSNLFKSCDWFQIFKLRSLDEILC